MLAETSNDPVGQGLADPGTAVRQVRPVEGGPARQAGRQGPLDLLLGIGGRFRESGQQAWKIERRASIIAHEPADHVGHLNQVATAVGAARLPQGPQLPADGVRFGPA